MSYDSTLFVVDSRTIDSSMSSAEPTSKIPMKHSKVTSMMWFLDDTIITGHDNGLVAAYDMRVSLITELQKTVS